MAKLSPRERQVAEFVAQGCAQKEIAARLGIGRDAVQQYTARARRKMGARNSAHLAALIAVEAERNQKGV